MGTINKNDLYYILGFGFLDFQNQDGKIVLSKTRPFSWIFDEIAARTAQSSNRSAFDKQIHFTIQDEELEKFISQHGVFTPRRYMPTISDEYAWSFIAGYFDAYGEFSFKNDNPRVFVSSPISSVIDFIAGHWKVKTPYSNKVMANGYKALDICGSMYKNVSISAKSHLKEFLGILNYSGPRGSRLLDHKFECMKLHPSAVEPIKSRVTDSGYDLHVVELNKLYTTTWGAGVYKAKTNLAVKPILGYAFDVAGRSSLPDSGWQFLQGVGICDRSYIGGIQATLMKLNDEPLPKMPWKALQIVPREAPIHAEFELKKTLGESDRGAGGFGSTNV